METLLFAGGTEDKTPTARAHSHGAGIPFEIQKAKSMSDGTTSATDSQVAVHIIRTERKTDDCALSVSSTRDERVFMKIVQVLLGAINTDKPALSRANPREDVHYASDAE
jgi:hypothetical protein